MITDYNYNYIFPECNQLQLQLHCNVIDLQLQLLSCCYVFKKNLV